MSIEMDYLETISEEVPDLAIQSATILNHGQNNVLLVINEELIFRFPRYPEGIPALLDEVQILKQIHSYLPLPVPAPVYIGRDTDTVGKVFMAYRKIPGEPMFRKEFNKIKNDSVLKKISSQLAGFLQVLHGLLIEPLPKMKINDRLQDWADFCTQVETHLFPYMRPERRWEIRQNFDSFLNNSQLHTFKPCLRHGDFGGSNILWEPTSGNVTGIIDFGGAGLGDPASDLASVSTFGDPFFERILKVYPVDEAAVARARFYRSTFALEEALFGWRNQDRTAFDAGMANYI